MDQEWDDMDPYDWLKILKALQAGDYGAAEGGRVPLRYGKRPRSEWLQLLDLDWDDMDPDEFEGILKALGVNKAQGGRVLMFAGGATKAEKAAWKAFIKKYFLKASNDIKLNKEGLTQDQWIKKHDDLTKKLKEWEFNNYGKIPKGMKKYFGMNEIQLVNAFKKAEAGAKELDILQKFVPEGKPHASGGLAGMLGE